ncbi:hypothetical protein [Marinirhabdus gelatinilytica]|nr:hypothetical protein [Marinirhabdus gelatinilytica]
MLKNPQIPLFILIGAFLCLSCVKDTNFDDADNIVLTPVVELDLIYFNLNASDFFDTISNTPRLQIIDTTEIKFLDDAFVQEDLERAEFLFNFTNSIPRSFQVGFQFLNEQNDTTYTTQTNVLAGTALDTETTIFTEAVANEEIMDLTRANKVVVAVTIPSADAALEGMLNLKSKTTYFLEIED